MPLLQQHLERIEKEFDKGEDIGICPHDWNNDNVKGYNEAKKELRHFIGYAITSYTEKIIKEVEGIKEKTRKFPMKSNGGNWDNWNEGYDKALSDILKILK